MLMFVFNSAEQGEEGTTMNLPTTKTALTPSCRPVQENMIDHKLGAGRCPR